MMEVLFSGQIPKDPNFPDDIEDAPILPIEDNRIVVSDGASESFDSKTWARLLSKNVCRYREPLGELVGRTIADYGDHLDFSALSWSKQAAFSRGSFATLLVLDHVTETNSIRVLSVGDSLAVLLDNGELIRSYPYQYADQFQQRPELISTKPALNSFLSSSEFCDLHQETWPLSDLTEPIVLCMTDALGEWALRREENGTPAWQELCHISEVSQLDQLVIQQRQAKAIRGDDTTLVRLTFTG